MDVDTEADKRYSEAMSSADIGDSGAMSDSEGPALPGGHAAYTRTATVYSQDEITAADLSIATHDPTVDALRRALVEILQQQPRVT